MEKINNSLPWNLLRLEILSRIRIAQREFLHTALIWHFFTTYRESEEFSELRKHFSRLKQVIVSIWGILNDLEPVGNKDKKCTDMFASCNKRSFCCFKKFLKINNQLKIALEKLDFFHRKASYILESFPPYYPAPNVFRARQELKAYNTLEENAEHYLKFFGKNLFNLPDEYEYKAHVYWETDPENCFLYIDKYQEDKNRVDFFFKGSYYMVNCPSLWILLAHEALHFLWTWCEKHYKDNNRKSILGQLQELQTDFFINMQALASRLNIEIDSNQLKPMYIDAICDALLTYILGRAYFIALWRIIFGYDEAVRNGLFSHQDITNWWIRLRVSLETAAMAKKDNLKKEDHQCFKRVLEDIHTEMAQVPGASERCIAEEQIYQLLINYAKYLIKQVIDRKYKDILKEEVFWLNIDKTLTDYVLGKIKDRENIDPHELEEGRIRVLASKNKFSLNKKELKKYEETKVILVRFLKVRFDGYKKESNYISNFFNKIKDHNVFLNLGAFQLVYIDSDFHDKPQCLDKEKRDVLESLLYNKPNSKNKVNSDFLWKAMIEGLLLYKEDIAASMLYYCRTNKTNEMRDWTSLQDKPGQVQKFFESLETILAIVEVKEPERANDNLDKFVKDFGNKLLFEERICDEVMIGYSFAWPNWVLFLKLHDGNQKSYKESLRRLKTILLDNPKFQFQRTHTSILIPWSLLQNNNSKNRYIATPDILIRLSGERTKNLGERAEKPMSKIEEEIKKENWELYLFPGIYDLILKHHSEEISFEGLKNIINILINTRLISDLQFRFSLKPINYKTDS